MSLNVKLVLGAAVIAAVTAYLAYVGASSTWRYYVHVDECAENPATFAGQRLRVNGRVAANSLQIRPDRSLANFSIRGATAEIPVSCSGPLPDNLAEDMDVVVEGTLDAGIPDAGSGLRLRGEKVLTRCASKYEAEASAARH